MSHHNPMKSFDALQLIDLTDQYGSPLWVYNADIIRQRIVELQCFDIIRYAQKANANIHILELMRAHGVKVDAVSLGEIERALAAGYQADSAEPSDIVFTADVLDRSTLERLAATRITVNAGSIDMLRQLGAASPKHTVWLRINPGFGHGHSHKTNTGGENSKHGIWHAQVADALAVIHQYGLRLVGLHMHIGSGVDYIHLQKVCSAMVRLSTALGHCIETISAGGGLPIPYRESDARIDTAHYFELWNDARRRISTHFGRPVRLEIEPGRFLVAESGALISEVRAVKTMGSRRFVLVDAGFNDLMRPAMYGSHHEISALSREGTEKSGERTPCVVAGPLCESGDVFTQQEGGVLGSCLLPNVQVGDFLVFHDAGAYGASMSSNYNSRPLLAETMLDGSSSRLIRRRQTMAELLELERV